MGPGTGCFLTLIVVGVAVLAPVLLFYRHGRQQREAKFSSAAARLATDSSGAVKELVIVGASMSTASLARLVQQTNLFTTLTHLLSDTSESHSARAVTELFAGIGPRLATVAPSDLTNLAVGIWFREPGSWERLEFGLNLLKYPRLALPSAMSQYAYQQSLTLLEKCADSAAHKRLALEVGRWHFGRLRQGGVPTMYDEQAIQNDILVRAK
jgi:hypothetical protein